MAKVSTICKIHVVEDYLTLPIPNAMNNDFIIGVVRLFWFIVAAMPIVTLEQTI